MRRALLLVAGALLVLVSCGVPLDSEPRSLGADGELEASQATSTTQPAPTARRATLYFTSEENLVRVQRPVEDEPSIQQVLELLLAGPIKSEQDRGLTTPIPEDTELLGATQDGDLLTVDLSSPILRLQGSGALLAYAQIVYTAVAFPEYDRVTFRVEGDPIEVPTDEGNLDVVTREDFASVAPGAD